MSLVFSNNAFSLLATGMTDADTTMTVADGSVFPSPTDGRWFPISMAPISGTAEIMHCTARAGNVLTVERAQEGTSARAFAPGTRVDHRLTAEALAEILTSANAALDHAIRAEEARDVAIANNSGSNGGDQWNGATWYPAERRARDEGIAYYALQPNINVKPSTDSSVWKVDPFFAGVMKSDAPPSWPAGLEFNRPIQSTNAGLFIVPADQIARNNTTPTISNGKEWLTGKWTPKGPSTYIRYKVWAFLNLFAAEAGKISLAMFVGTAFRGATTVDFAAGEHKSVYFEGVDIGAPAAGEYDVSLRAGNTATGGTTFWLNRNADNALYGNGLHSRLGVAERVIQP